MTLAIERAIVGPTRKDEERAARWAAAWGLLCGIRTEGINLKSCDVKNPDHAAGETPDAIAALSSPSPRERDSVVQAPCPSGASAGSPLVGQTAGAAAARPPAQPNTL